MIVVDTSTLITLFVAEDQGRTTALNVLARDPAWAAPPHQPAELLNALRGLTASAKITPDHAEQVLQRWQQSYIQVLPLNQPVIGRIWQLRHNMSAYDAAYVAVAEANQLQLVTSDARWAAVPSIRCELILVK